MLISGRSARGPPVISLCPHGPLKRSASLSHCDWDANKKTGKRVTCLDSLTTTLYPPISVSSSPSLALSIPHSVTLSICGFWSSQISFSWCCSGNAGTNEAERLIFSLPHHSGLSRLTVSFFSLSLLNSVPFYPNAL